MKKQSFNFSGILKYNQSAQYELHYHNNIVNISTILNNILNSNKKYIEIKIMNCCKLIYEEQGNLMWYKSYDTGVVDYHINGNCLGDLLFNCTDELLDVEIYSEVLDVQGDNTYAKQHTYETKQCAK